MNGSAPPYSVRFDPASSIIEVTMRGFWTLEDHAAYAADIRKTAAPLIARRRWFAIIVDNTEFGVQSAEVSQALIETADAKRSRNRAPTALVVKGLLSRVQAHRIAEGPHVRIGTTRKEALDWIEANAPLGWKRPL